MLTRESVFVLRWNTLGIALKSHPGRAVLEPRKTRRKWRQTLSRERRVTGNYDQGAEAGNRAALRLEGSAIGSVTQKILSKQTGLVKVYPSAQ
jgi:hypothetical protein